VAPSSGFTLARAREPMMRVLPLALGFALAGLVACEHAQPFGASPADPNQPFSSAFPRQLTFSAGPDLAPAWLPEGSGIVYSFALLRADNDRCLGILPAEGGHQLRAICHVPLEFDADSTNALWEPAVGPSGALAYLRESSLPGSLAPHSREIVVASLTVPDPGRVVVRLPYTAPDGLLHASASHLHWVNATTLVYRAEQVIYYTNGGFADTLVSPLEIVRADFAGDSTVLTVVPGTANATSLTVDSSGAIIYTLVGDTRVYRVDPVSGVSGALYDFGNAGIPSDVQVSGKVLVAMIGGHLARATVGDTVVVLIPSPDPAQLVLRPALAPSGARVVIELSGSDPSNLWLLQVP